MLAYLDTSAFLKLVAQEDHSTDLIAWATTEDASFVSSDLLRTEALRAVRNHPPQVRAAVRERLSVVTCLSISRAICDLAAELHPSVLRSLDALHVATALTAGTELDVVLTYDARMADAAAVVGLRPLAPGQS